MYIEYFTLRYAEYRAVLWGDQILSYIKLFNIFYCFDLIRELFNLKMIFASLKYLYSIIASYSCNLPSMLQSFCQLTRSSTGRSPSRTL